MPPIKSHRLTTAAALVAILSLATPPAALAQDPMADSFCVLFTSDEVGDIMGEAVAATPTFEACSWTSAEPEGKFVFVSAGWAEHTIDERMEIETGVELTVGGRRAFSTPDYKALYVELDAGVLLLSGGTKKQLTQLGELAVPRAASLLAPSAPEPEPEPSVVSADPELEALFPESIGGTPVTVTVGPLDSFFSAPEDRQRLDDALAESGGTFDDVSAVMAGSVEPPYTIIAFRVAGGDASVLLPFILSMTEGVDQSPGEISGKAMTLISTSESVVGAASASGEVVWLMQAADPTLTEIISALP